MLYTQVELTRPATKTVAGAVEVWWLPVPEKRAKVGEIITRKMYDQACAPTENPFYYEDWTITQVCLTLKEEDLPIDAKKAEDFERTAQTLQYMKM